MNAVGNLTLVLRLVGASCRVAATALSFPVTCLVSRRVRHTVWRAYELFFGSARAGVYPECSLGEIIRLSDPVQLVELHAKSYNVTETELLCLIALERTAKTTKAFEFGTADGRTSRNLAANLEPGGLLLTLNIAPDLDSTHHHDVAVGQRFLGTAEAARIQQLWGDSRRFDGTPYQAQCQCIFVDADHSVEGVRADSKNALLMVDRQFGLILWHDALRYGVQEVLPALARDRQLPIHLIERTNLAVLCFSGGQPVAPANWLAPATT